MNVLEINVDDVGLGGVYALVCNVIGNRPDGLKMDIACIAEFEDPDNVAALRRLGTDVYYVGTHGSRLSRPVAYYRNALALLKGSSYDCVHIHGDVAYLLLIFALAARKAGVRRIILHSHAAGIDGGSRRIKTLLHRLCRGRLARCATEFAACSDVAASWMFPGVAADRVRMIRNGVVIERYAYDPDKRRRVRAELGLSDAFVVGHVGRFAYQKNHEYLLRVFSAIRERIKGARLLLVGEGTLFEQTRRKAARMGLTDDVIFYGASRDVGALMQAMDLFVLPSRFEGLPVVGVEAQTAGLPILFSDRVTRQAGLIDRAWFLPATARAVGQWADRAEAIAGDPQDRTDAWRRIADAGFDVQDAVRGFAELYGLGRNAADARLGGGP